jgi:hypothetical protein
LPIRAGYKQVLIKPIEAPKTGFLTDDPKITLTMSCPLA